VRHEEETPSGNPRRIDWLRIQPLIAIHLACLLAAWIDWNPVAAMRRNRLDLTSRLDHA
jgi:hypothetical protein